jgi:hypothetical protein
VERFVHLAVADSSRRRREGIVDVEKGRLGVTITSTVNRPGFLGGSIPREEGSGFAVQDEQESEDNQRRRPQTPRPAVRGRGGT